MKGTLSPYRMVATKPACADRTLARLLNSPQASRYPYPSTLIGGSDEKEMPARKT